MWGHCGAELTNRAVGVFTGKTNHTKDNFTFENNETTWKQLPNHTILRMKKHDQTNEGNKGSPVSWFAIVAPDLYSQLDHGIETALYPGTPQQHHRMIAAGKGKSRGLCCCDTSFFL